MNFIKMHGTGNDFVVLDGWRDPLPAEFDFAAAAIELCDRHRGVGGDGLLLLAPAESPERGEARMRMWNPDGSEDMCGNGLRCIALLAWRRGYVGGREFAVQTLAGTRHATILEPGEVRVGMGRPNFDLSAVPMLNLSEFVSAHGLKVTRDYALRVAELTLPHVTTLSTGTAHTVVFLEKPLEESDFQRISPLLEHHPIFPERTSIMWTTVVDDSNLRLRIWERGAGETLACGTGACAAAIAAIATGRCYGGVTVESLGGRLRIAWRPDREIQMTGPATVVYEGEWGGSEMAR